MSLWDDARTVRAGEFMARVAVEGDPAGPTLLLLHGFGRSLEDWGPAAKLLASGHKVVRADLPGFGLAPRPPEAASLRAMTRGVIDVLDAAGVHEPVHVAGNSLGGAVAAQLLVEAPQRVRSLILVAPAGYGGKVTPLLRMLTVPGLGWLATRRTTRIAARALASTIFADRSLVTDDEIARSVALGGQPGMADFTLQMVRSLGTWRGVRPEWRAQLARDVTRTPRPTLIVWGEEDRVLPVSHMEEARRVFPDAECVRYPRTGHAPQLERPEDVTGRVAEFVTRVENHSNGSEKRGRRED